MIFEGSEKKLEVVVKPGFGSLRELGEDYWSRLVAKCKAQILSKVSNDKCDAYLLSESSLFVWADRFTMITCGQTTLINSAIEFLKTHSIEKVDSLIFERKNEYFPHMQESDFLDDVQRLNLMADGKGYRLGSADEHHIFLYHLKREFKPNKVDRTLEILMYELQPPAAEFLISKGLTREKLRQFIDLSTVLPGFEIDDHVFEPYGYSLNAIRGEQYYTIHVTPQESSSYVSFETNVHNEDCYRQIITRLTEIFKPLSLDTVSFSAGECGFLDLSGYQTKNQVQEALTCGYTVNFAHYYQPVKSVRRAKPI